MKKTARKTKGAKATRGKASSASQAKAKRALRPAPKAASHKAAGKLPKKAALAKKPEAAARPAKRERPAAAQNGANGKAAAAPAQQARAAGDSAVRRKSGDGAAQRDGARSASARPRAGGGREGALRVRGSAAPEPAAREAPRVVPLPLPMLPPVRRPSVEERSASIDVRLEAQGDDFKHRYLESFDMSWIYHDSALEGVVYTFDELRAALGGEPPPVSDSGLQPTFDDIRRHKEAIDFVRDFAIKKRLPVTLDVVKKLYLILHPEEGDIKTVKYRKDIPQHRLYFHEYAPPDKIAYKVRQIVDWLNDPETRKTRNGIRIAARAHYDLLRVYPFPVDSGKVSRLFMNLLLLRSGLPPSIIHSTERQRYYEALKGSATTVLQMVQESVENALSSVEKLLDEHESRKRAFVS